MGQGTGLSCLHLVLRCFGILLAVRRSASLGDYHNRCTSASSYTAEEHIGANHNRSSTTPHTTKEI